jgi:hypothetical protein
MVSWTGELCRRSVGDETIGDEMRVISTIAKPEDCKRGKVPESEGAFPNLYLVIPGCAVGAGPESITPVLAFGAKRRHGIMDSGLAQERAPE